MTRFKNLLVRDALAKWCSLCALITVLSIGGTTLYCLSRPKPKQPDIHPVLVSVHKAAKKPAATKPTRPAAIAPPATKQPPVPAAGNSVGASPVANKVTIGKGAVSQPVITPQPHLAAAPAPHQVQLYVAAGSPAASQADSWAASRPADAAAMRRLAGTPVAEWYGDWTPNVTGTVAGYVSQAAAAGQMPVLVAYNIPNRDCGSYSAGGAGSAAAYGAWIQSFANGIGHRSAIVILEPDALPGLDCLTASGQTDRLNMLASAVTTLRQTTNASIYMDAGNSTWQSAATMANRLRQANVAAATGFSLNVSGFNPTGSSLAYGNQLSSLLGGKHFVIDTSRNGNGSNGQWCNPSGRALGNTPTLNTGQALADAYLWIKRPGESDGTCNGGPAAGIWWGDYALALARAAGW